MSEKLFVSGDEAVALAVRQAKPHVIAAYPITPQTIVVERLSDFVEDGSLNSQYMYVESEHSAMCACLGASSIGARTFTATSSQGLLYMVEGLHYASGSRFPIVMMNANRSIAAPWNIYGDQRDSLAELESGWIQMYAENAQEAYDTILEAYKVAEDPDVMLPVMVNLDGFVLTHTYELLHTAGENVPADFYWGLVTSVVMQEIWLFWERASGVHAFPISTVTLFRWILVMGAFLSAVVYYGKEKPFTFHDVAVTIVGGIVFPAMYSCIFLLRMDENYGKLYVLAPFCVAFVGDALSMYFGMWFGKRKMAPHVSPHKTWAGAIGGPIGSALALVLLGVVGKAWLGYAPNYLMLILVGVVANIFGQLGDLSMSLVKREAGIKDYSHLFLTHGGMLDRFDSTLFIAPVVWAAVCGGLL